MKIGTAEIQDRIGDPDPIRPPVGGGSSAGGYDPGGDPRRPEGGEGVDTQSFTPEKFRILTYFLLLIALMTFGGLIGAYVVIATNNVAEWTPFALPVQVWLSTLLIFASSVTYYLAERAVRINDHTKGKNFLLATTILGGVFIASQLLAWIELSRRGLYMQGNPYVGFFYLLTAVHAVHVIGGITALATILLRSWYPTSSDEIIAKRVNLAQVVGWYWHFMGLLWIVLFVLLGYWK